MYTCLCGRMGVDSVSVHRVLGVLVRDLVTSIRDYARGSYTGPPTPRVGRVGRRPSPRPCPPRGETNPLDTSKTLRQRVGKGGCGGTSRVIVWAGSGATVGQN